MWFNSLDSTNYILVLSVLIILGVFALIVFGSLPCSCKYIVLMKYCFKRRSSRVGDSNRSHVIGGGIMDPENTPRYPEVPFTIATTAENSSQFPQRMSIHTHINPFEIPTRELTFYSLSPTNLPYSPAYGQRDPMKQQKWDEPPPPYEALFPIAVEELKETQSKSKCLPTVPAQPSTEL